MKSDLDEVAIGVARFISRYRQFSVIKSYSFREAYKRSFFLEYIEVDEDLVLRTKEHIKRFGLDAPLGVYSNP
ncbi:MAG: hypothetical protein ACXQTS_00550 [Candidatus Methanospirareceae archaeon]